MSWASLPWAKWSSDCFRSDLASWAAAAVVVVVLDWA